MVLKIYDPRFTSHRLQTQRPWVLEFETQAARRRSSNAPFEFTYPEWPQNEDAVGWEEWYFQQADISSVTEIAAYSKLVSLQGRGVAHFFGSGTIHLPGRAITPRVLLLEYLPNAKDLTTIPADLLTPPIVQSLKTTVSWFSRLGVVHCDLNYNNILLLCGSEGVYRAVVIDFGEACVRDESYSKEDWATVVYQNDDMGWLEKRTSRIISQGRS